jgi:phosphate uptake regulator
MNELAEQMAGNYISRITDGTCPAGAAIRYLSLSTDVERAADHFVNIAKVAA